MICFATVAEQIEFGGCDTLLFTSKQAVLTAEAIDPAWRSYPSIAIGSATKRQIEVLGGEVLYHPTHFYGEALSQDIATFFATRSLLYLRPEVISFDSKAFLAREGIVLHEQILYRTSCIEYDATSRPPSGAVIVFTSPSTIHCFVKQFGWEESYHAVVIGYATQEHLPQGALYSVAETPLIDACIQKAQEIAKS